VSERGLRSVGSDLYGAAQHAQHLQPEEALPSDDRLLDRVRSELFRDPTVPKGQINVSVEAGTVVLRGHVADDATKDAVERRARSITGVQSVENRINAGV
jgi:osmotically-inducible protein OsmY